MILICTVMQINELPSQLHSIEYMNHTRFKKWRNKNQDTSETRLILHKKSLLISAEVLITTLSDSYVFSSFMDAEILVAPTLTRKNKLRAATPP